MRSNPLLNDTKMFLGGSPLFSRLFWNKRGTLFRVCVAMAVIGVGIRCFIVARPHNTSQRPCLWGRVCVCKDRLFQHLSKYLKDRGSYVVLCLLCISMGRYGGI